MKALRTILTAVASLTTALALASCDSSSPAPASQKHASGPVAEPAIHITGRWNITSVSTGSKSPAPVAARAFIQFNKDGTFAAFDGVNHLGGTFGVIVNGQGLRFIDMTSNLLGAGGPVPAPPTETQSAFTTMASAKAITYLIEGNRLLLTCSNLRLTALHA